MLITHAVQSLPAPDWRANYVAQKGEEAPGNWNPNEIMWPRRALQHASVPSLGRGPVAMDSEMKGESEFSEVLETPYLTIEDHQANQPSLAALPHAAGAITVLNGGSFPSADAAHRERLSLLRSGTETRVVQGVQGDYRLRAGPFAGDSELLSTRRALQEYGLTVEVSVLR